MKRNKLLRRFLNTTIPPMAANGVYTAADFMTVLLQAAQTNTFLEGTCERTDGACDAETIFDKLEGMDPDELHETFIRLITPQVKGITTTRRNRKVVLAGDVTYEAYYGEDENEWIHKQVFHKGATGSYQFMAVSIVLNGKPMILGYLPLKKDNEKDAILRELLSVIMRIVPVETVLLDREFNSGRVIQMLKELHLSYVILWRKYEWHREVFKSMGREHFHRIECHPLKDGVQTDLVFVKGIRVKGDKRAYNWVFAANLTLSKPIRYIQMYKHRWAIETMFRVTDELWIKTKTKDMGKRFFLALFTVLLYNLWKWFRDVTEMEVTFSTFTNHFARIHQGFVPARRLKPDQRLLRSRIGELCFYAGALRHCVSVVIGKVLGWCYSCRGVGWRRLATNEDGFICPAGI